MSAASPVQAPRSVGPADRPAAGRPAAEPVMGVTGYDRVSAGVIAAALGLIVTVAYLFVQWYMQHEFAVDTLPPMEVIQVGGGDLDGAPDDAPLLESLAEAIPDPSLSELREDEMQVEELMETVVDVSDRAANPSPTAVNSDSTGGKVGSASGSGGRPLGFGPGDGGVSAEQRWFISFNEQGGLEEYARQLDFFGIELGALDTRGGSLTIISNLTAPKPTVTVKQGGGADEQRLYMIWQGGGRKQADVKLFAKAGLDASELPILHFYPARTEQTLLRLEQQHANRPLADVRRTYFEVQPGGGGYTFRVAQQSYLR
ncbi:hypothetical protein [Alienimonas californiensis]|uniref:Uncharacterized protein n=1 Tax=Alienimonas californiensis TaxID=2527989 RepID=A0A517PC98_9PLAN|nr:hypothetical protein [Alienimonas californiensis]QDT16992.1 hypothetical protein CA12_31020 [Alienimonas californiensis]